MSRCRVVEPKSVRLSLSDGDFVDVKQQLTAGETRQVYSGMVKEQRFGESATADPSRVGLTKILVYVIGWSLIDLDGRPIKFSESALLGQDFDTFKEIHDAIDAHIVRVEQETEDRKKTTGGGILSDRTSVFVGT